MIFYTVLFFYFFSKKKKKIKSQGLWTGHQESLNAIVTFLTSLSSSNLQNNKILPLNVVSTVNKKTNVVSLVVSSVDSLYYYVLPYLDSSNMYTRKAIDFKLWRVALLLKIHGYYFLPEGKKLFLVGAPRFLLLRRRNRRVLYQILLTKDIVKFYWLFR